MSRDRYPLAVLAAVLLAGCAPAAQQSAPSSAPRTVTVVRTPPRVAPPPDPVPVRTANCPYLDRENVGRTNGQRVGRVRISADRPHPACFFYRPDGNVQLTVRVYQGSPDVAHALVDAAAPPGTSARADQPVGWTGGAQPTAKGAVYAVTKGGAAVVVTTNQRQTVKAREVAEQTIAALHL